MGNPARASFVLATRLFVAIGCGWMTSVAPAAADTTDREHRSTEWTRDSRHLEAWKELAGESERDGGGWGGLRRDPCGLFGEGRGTDACSQEDDYGRDGGHDH